MNPKAILDAERPRTRLSTALEKKFKEWYRIRSTKAGIDPNPDHPAHKYDYRGAFKAGKDMAIDDADGKFHWSSQFKDEDHPNRYVNGIDTRTGKPALFQKVKRKVDK